MARHKNGQWGIPDKVMTWDQATLAVLMDLRDELQEIKGVLQCYRFRGLPDTLTRIDRRLSKKISLVVRGKAKRKK